jgi:hypothetical protein
VKIPRVTASVMFKGLEKVSAMGILRSWFVAYIGMPQFFTIPGSLRMSLGGYMMFYITVIVKTNFIGNTADASFFFLCKLCRSYSREDYGSIVAAYYEFLKTASESLSRRVTDVCLYSFLRISD